MTARADVDPERIGFTGESGGSNTTYWIAAVDPRVKLAVPVSSVTTFDYWIRGDINWDWHQRPPGIRRVADIGTLLALHAPNPLVVISSQRGTDDAEFPLHEAEKSHQWANTFTGCTTRMPGQALRIHHGFTRLSGGSARQELYPGCRTLAETAASQAGKELPAQIEAVEDATRSKLPENNQTFRDYLCQWLQPVAAGEADEPTACRKFLPRTAQVGGATPAIGRQLLASEEHGDWTARFWIIDTEAGIRLPVVSISPKTGNGCL